MPYGQMWRDRRRCFHQYFNQGAVGAYHAVQIREVHAFLRRALVSPARNVDAHSISQSVLVSLDNLLPAAYPPVFTRQNVGSYDS